MKEHSTDKTSPDASSRPYKHSLLEDEWQKKWVSEDLYKTPMPKDSQRRFYALSMFPYPSGNLHMGHVRNYVITDVIARKRRMDGFAVLHPMGWDSFGLPAENAAIERGIQPSDWTEKNIAQMKKQLKRLGLSIDWNKELTTCHTDYYKWTQYIFLKLFNSGLAYQKKAKVNWDPIDKTVLANEQVDADGRSWRSGAVVQQKELKQWFLRITDYSEDLLKDIQKLKEWPERVKTMQTNWIGRSEGMEINFNVIGFPNKTINVFTTRPDTIYGVSYIVLSPYHPFIDEITQEENKTKVAEYINMLNQKDIKCSTSIKEEKSGVSTGAYVKNPINNQNIPIWIANYVLTDYGSGAVMGVPAHDERDYEFAQKYKLTISQVISNSKNYSVEDSNKPYLEEGVLINSNERTGLTTREAKKNIIEEGIKKGWGKYKVEYRLRDWLISRQRYWGCPIPIIHCNSCGTIPIDNKDLPVELPSASTSSQTIVSDLSSYKDWVNIKCPRCNLEARRETDTMDTFMCSSWYFLRFTDSSNNKEPFNKDVINHWLPVDQYVGGIEHAILHLLYSRFITKALNSADLISIDEPFKRLLTQGMVQGITYKNTFTGKYIAPEEVKNTREPRDPRTGDELEVLYEKMSKSKYNGVDPCRVIDKYGADTARMFVLFKAPPEKDLEWNDADVEGQHRFLQRIWRLLNKFNSHDIRNLIPKFNEPNKTDNSDLNALEKSLRTSIHKAIKEVTEDLSEDFQFNTAISELMKLTNSMYSSLDGVNINLRAEAFSVLIRLLAPFAPHIAEELWSLLGGKESVHKQQWPKYIQEYLQLDNVKIVIQIQGKVRGAIEVERGSEQLLVEKKVLDSSIAKKWLDNKTPKRIIFIPDKLINLVI